MYDFVKFENKRQICNILEVMGGVETPRVVKAQPFRGGVLRVGVLTIQKSSIPNFE